MDRMDYFIDLYGSLPRGGPGDNVSTRKAFGMMEHLPSDPRILDCRRWSFSGCPAVRWWRLTCCRR